jgi:hypothetical protein
MVSPRKTAPDAPPISATARDSARLAGPIRPAVAVVRLMWNMRRRLFSHSREHDCPERFMTRKAKGSFSKRGMRLKFQEVPENGLSWKTMG